MARAASQFPIPTLAGASEMTDATMAGHMLMLLYHHGKGRVCTEKFAATDGVPQARPPHREH